MGIILEIPGHSRTKKIPGHSRTFKDRGNHGKIMDYCVTSKPWSIVNENEKSSEYNKYLYQNHLQNLSPTPKAHKGPDISPTPKAHKVPDISPTPKAHKVPDISTSIVDAMGVVRMDINCWLKTTYL